MTSTYVATAGEDKKKVKKADSQRLQSENRLGRNLVLPAVVIMLLVTAFPMMRALYATDASEYQEHPLAVALPSSESDLRELVSFAHQHRVGLIPRAAGTSLAGQVVGNGIVVDLGRHLNRIIDLDVSRRRIRVQRDWGTSDAGGLFLREVRDGACRVFDGVLGPEYNEAHRDHFHLDRGGWRVCR